MKSPIFALKTFLNLFSTFQDKLKMKNLYYRKCIKINEKCITKLFQLNVLRCITKKFILNVKPSCIANRNLPNDIKIFLA